VDEVCLAVEIGYRIFEIYEVYEYQVTGYNLVRGEGGLFVDFINTVFKMKAEASGFPGWINTPEVEERYVEWFLASEGIWLDKEAIRYTDAKSGLAKLCLNSMWGKLTDWKNRPVTKIITESKVQCGFVATPGIEVKRNLVFGNDDIFCIS